MNVFRLASASPVPTDAKSFTGRVRSRRVASPGGVVPAHIYRVEFEARARTHWHTHSGPQWLFVVAGRIRVQRWRAPAEDVDAGDLVTIDPGEKHWHGAAPDSASATHIAVNVNATTEWLEPVSDEQYAIG